MNLDSLTAAEQQIFSQLVLGGSNKEIANATKRSVTTVDRHLKNIFIKLEMSSRTKLIANYYRGL